MEIQPFRILSDDIKFSTLKLLARVFWPNRRSFNFNFKYSFKGKINGFALQQNPNWARPQIHLSWSKNSIINSYRIITEEELIKEVKTILIKEKLKK